MTLLNSHYSSILQDPRVIDCLKVSGAQDIDILAVRSSSEKVRDLYQRFSKLYNKLARFETTTTATEPEDEDEEDDEKEEDDEGEGLARVFYERPESNVQVFEVLDAAEWESYLKNIEPDKSTQTLAAALNKTPPLTSKLSLWLQQVVESKLFMESVWLAQVKAMHSNHLSGEDLAEFVEQAAADWLKLAASVDSGSVPFSRLEEIIDMEPNPASLSHCHLDRERSWRKIPTSYRNFRNLSNIRHLITPFVTALRFFDILDKSAIERIYEFVTSELVNNWEGMTLEEVARMGIINTIDKELAIDCERPETLAPIQFIASLVSDEGNSPLIEWLRKKTERDFEAMGKILQGALFEAYGNAFKRSCLLTV